MGRGRSVFFNDLRRGMMKIKKNIHTAIPAKEEPVSKWFLIIIVPTFPSILLYTYASFVAGVLHAMIFFSLAFALLILSTFKLFGEVR